MVMMWAAVVYSFISSAIQVNTLAIGMEITLREKLFTKYLPSLLPAINKSTILKITFNMKLIRLLYVEEKSQEVTSQAYFSMKWYNDYLKWDPKDFGNIKYLPVRPDQVWIPDIILKNSAGAKAIQVEPGTDTVWIEYTGKHAWYPKVTMRSSFKADIVDFPFDNQLFVFHFGSWSLGEKKLKIEADYSKAIVDQHYLEDAEWALSKTKKEIIRTSYESDRYTEIVFTYTVSRKPAYSIITAVAPAFGLMTLTLFSYILPPNNGERIKVILTSLLAFTVFLVAIIGYLPRNSETVPMLQVFYMITMAECTLCFITTCFFARFFGNEEKSKAAVISVPTWVVKYVFRLKEENKEQRDPSCKSLTNDASAKNQGHKCLNSDHCTANTGNESYKEKPTQMSWSKFLQHVDQCCMKVIVFLFVCTILVLFPSYYRRYHSTLVDETHVH